MSSSLLYPDLWRGRVRRRRGHGVIRLRSRTLAPLRDAATASGRTLASLKDFSDWTGKFWMTGRRSRSC